MLGDCKITFRGQELIVTNVRVNYMWNEMWNEDRQEYQFEAVSNPYADINNMSSIKTIPENVDKVLDENWKAFYQLGWIDEVTLELTSNGRVALGNWLFQQHEKDFGTHAKQEVTKIKEEEAKQ